MGKIFSKPKMPPLPKIEPTVVETPEDTAPDPEAEAARLREENLRNRRRGRLGTVATSFRGVLSDSSLVPTRKTLLGE